MKAFSGNELLCAIVTSIVACSGIVLLDRWHSEAVLKDRIRAVIQEHPELVVNALHEYHQDIRSEAVARVAQSAALLAGDLKDHPNFPFAGNPNGDVTVIEFFDYQCVHCQHLESTIAQLISEDHNVRIVFKEFPVLGADSATLAKAALAVNHIDPAKYYLFHHALMKFHDSPTEGLAHAAQALGIEPSAFLAALTNPELQEELDRNKMMAQTLRIEFTPAVIVGSELEEGTPAFSVLEDTITRLRNSAGKM
jgi:protein-disulfide isomerase